MTGPMYAMWRELENYDDDDRGMSLLRVMEPDMHGRLRVEERAVQELTAAERQAGYAGPMWQWLTGGREK